MIKNIKDSLSAKLCLITAFLLLFMGLAVYGLLAWSMPRTYANELNGALERRTQALISQLARSTPEESAGLFERFLQNDDIVRLELSDESGSPVPLPSRRPENTREESTTDDYGLVMEAVAETADGDTAPLLSASYPFSFAGDDTRYILTVYGTAAQLAQLRQTFVQIFPILLLACVLTSLAVSWLYSFLITRPLLSLCRIARQMSEMELSWPLKGGRTDELGILEQSLHTMSERLSATLCELQSANERLAEDIRSERAREQARSDFFSAASHELKTPVTIIRGQLEGMLLRIGVYKDRDKYLARSLEAADRLQGMVQEILTISRLESSGTQLASEPFDLIPLVRSCLEEQEDLLAEKEQSVCRLLPASAWTSGNRLLLKQALASLIGNAVLYSPARARITIRIQASGDGWLCSVENSGVFLPEDELTRLFEPFYRREASRSRRTGGSGLGLYLVQKILQQYDSCCRAENTEDGVRFSFSLHGPSDTRSRV